MVEIELKYQFSDAAVFARWAAADNLDAVYRIEPTDRAAVSVRDTYLDTPDYRLLRNGYSLRHRRKDGGAWLTLKSVLLPGPDDAADPAGRRIEIEEALAGETDMADHRCYPPAIHSRIERFLHGPLRPIAVIIQEREKRWIRQMAAPPAPGEAGQRPVEETAAAGEETQPFTGEVSIDRVEIFAPSAGGQNTEEAVGTFFELEVELLAGDGRHLVDIARLLEGDPSLCHHKRSKLEKALDLIAGHQPGTAPGAAGLRPEMPMSEAGRTILRDQFNAMIQLEAGVRLSDDDEYVHQMRVAMRRSRAALRLFADYLDRKQLATFNRLLRKTGRKLGKVRDLDVALEKGRRITGIDPALEAQWQADRARAHKKLLKWLDSKQYGKFLTTYDDFCRTWGAGARLFDDKPGKSPTRTAVAHVVPSLILERFQQVRAYEQLFAQDQQVPYATVHALRIDCKTLRYTLEFFEELMGADATILIDRLKKLQDLLGDLNDAVVATELLQNKSPAARTDGRNGNDAGVKPDEEGIETHLEHQQAITGKLYARVPRQLDQFTRLKSRKLLGRALMRM